MQWKKLIVFIGDYCGQAYYYYDCDGSYLMWLLLAIQYSMIMAWRKIPWPGQAGNIQLQYGIVGMTEQYQAVTSIVQQWLINLSNKPDILLIPAIVSGNLPNIQWYPIFVMSVSNGVMTGQWSNNIINDESWRTAM